MHSLLIVIISLAIFVLGYRFYSKFIADNIFQLNNDKLRDDLWITFGASNQMLAALTLMILSIYFWMIFKGTIRIRKIYRGNV